MMTNLFSSFDPTAAFNLPWNWMSATIFIPFLTPSFWPTPSKKTTFTLKLGDALHNEFKTLLGSHAPHCGAPLIFVALFLFFLVNNFLGLFPYIFTSSSHMALTLGLALPLWASFMIYGWINNTLHMFAHLVPNGTPGALMPFMVMIETISNIIRPLTLSIRLMANMVAGHLLMTLLGSQTALSANFILASLIIIQILLLTLETAVTVIQAYVFAVLSTLYSSEVMPQ